MDGDETQQMNEVKDEIKEENLVVLKEHEENLKNLTDHENEKNQEKERVKLPPEPSLEAVAQQFEENLELVDVEKQNKVNIAAEQDELPNIEKEIANNIKLEPYETIQNREEQVHGAEKLMEDTDAIETNEGHPDLKDKGDEGGKPWTKEKTDKLLELQQNRWNVLEAEDEEDLYSSFNEINCPNSLSSRSSEEGAMNRMTLSFCNFEKADGLDSENELEEEWENEKVAQDKTEKEPTAEIKQLNDNSNAHKTAAYELNTSLHNKIMDDFEKKRLAVEDAFSRWYPSGLSLIKELRGSADKLDTNQKGTNIAGLLGGVTGLVGAAMSLFPPTLPIGVAVGLTGAATGLGASGANYVASSYIEKYVNDMVKNQESGYTQLTDATDDFKYCVQQHYEYLDEYCSGGITDIIQKKSDSGQVDDQVLRDAGKAVMAVANAEKLARVAPYLRYAGMSNKAVKAAMVKDAVHLAHLAKASGVSGAASKALRASEISKATSAFKIAKEGVKVGAQGVAMATFGAVIAIVEITVNVKELASGSIVAKAEDYRAMADKMDIMLQDITILMSQQNSPTTPSKI